MIEITIKSTIAELIQVAHITYPCFAAFLGASVVSPE
jgi:hypothetical protein